MEVNKENQLKIDKYGLIVTFRHRSGDKYAVPLKHMQALVFGSMRFIYANEWIPKPEGRPKGFSPKKKIITLL